MKFIDEFRDPDLARRLIGQIRHEVAAHTIRPVRLMEFCGGHTHAIFHYGLRQTLEGDVELRSGPGCPVCVTASRDLDTAMALSGVQPDVILATFGDMVRAMPGAVQELPGVARRRSRCSHCLLPLDALSSHRPTLIARSSFWVLALRRQRRG